VLKKRKEGGGKGGKREETLPFLATTFKGTGPVLPMSGRGAVGWDGKREKGGEDKYFF